MSESQTRVDSPPLYKRVLLKISGEALMGRREYGLDPEMVAQIAADVGEVRAMGVDVCLVVGGGNIFRGVSAASRGMERASADYMGMLATVINALALQSALENIDVHTRVQSAIPMATVAEPYIRRRAVRHMEKGRVVIFAAGTGNPFFTTDTAAAQRALELDADVVLKATRVDGVYSEDPEKNPHAVLYESLSYNEVMEKNLKVMDATAIALCQEHAKPILVFNFKQDGNIIKAISGDSVGTWIGQQA